MANHVSTTLTIENLDQQSYDKLKEIFNDGTNEYYTDVKHIINKMYDGTDIEQIDDQYNWWVSNIGSKWLEVESSVSEGFETEVQLYLTSAWNVPDEFIQKLRDILVQINNEVVLSGTYEDESLDPIGAFIYAKDYDDIEDFDIEVDFDKYWDDDEYKESIYDELLEHKNGLYQVYLETIEDRKNEENL